jgi:hypothetical protein
MAAISTINRVTSGLSFLRQAATTSQTDWFAVPPWAKSIQVYLSITTAGTNTIATLHSADPILKDDVQALALFTGATITAASNHVYHIIPATIGTADADSATADADVIVPASLPTLFGVQVAATGSTYTFSVSFGT